MSVRMVVLGDSTASGLGDRLPDGRWRGFATLLAERAYWSIDRLHPSELGHRRLARCFAESLRDAGWPVQALPSLEASGGVAPTALADQRWLMVEGVPWAGRKVRDLVPWAATLAGREMLRRARLADRAVAP